MVNLLDSTRFNQRNESFPLLSIRHARSRFARDTTPCESSRVVKCLGQINSVWVFWTRMTEMLFRKKRLQFCFSFQQTGHKVGFKPAGGIRSAKDALTWLSLMKEELGDDWTHPNLFRIGASSLLGDIERQLFHHVTGR